MSPILICTHDDRPAAQTGLKLLLLSLANHCPDTDALVSCPAPGPAFSAWIEQQSGVQLHIEPGYLGKGWNIKPDLLLHCLDLGYEQVVWIDSDIIVARDFRDLLGETGSQDVIVAEDFYWAAYCFPGSSERTRLWGLQAGRPLLQTANTGILAITQAHRPLLQAWKTLLDSPAYLQTHQREWYTRPIHMVGDQDVLTALLGSERFAGLPVKFLRRGEDVIYNFGPSGYTPLERIHNLGKPEPPFVHCSGPKPWEVPAQVSLFGSPGKYYKRLGLEVADYSRVARRYRHQFEAHDIAFDPVTFPARLFHRLTRSRAPLTGLPLALFHGLGRRLCKLLGYNYWPNVEANLQPGEQADGETILDGGETGKPGIAEI